MTRSPHPRDVPRRFVMYIVRRSGGREVWRAMRGTQMVSRYGFAALRRMMR